MKRRWIVLIIFVAFVVSGLISKRMFPLVAIYTLGLLHGKTDRAKPMTKAEIADLNKRCLTRGGITQVEVPDSIAGNCYVMDISVLPGKLGYVFRIEDKKQDFRPSDRATKGVAK